MFIASLFATSFLMANEVNVFNARHYKADAELFSKFTNKTGIKINLINGKAGALEKRMDALNLIVENIELLDWLINPDTGVTRKQLINQDGV